MVSKKISARKKHQKIRFTEIQIQKYSGFPLKIKGNIPLVKNNNYCIVKKVSVGGDAPKEFASIYRYGFCRKAFIRSWPQYIVKTGHKWYPAESITEYLLNRIAQVMGLNVAEPFLLFVGNQIRFGSRYFLKKNQELIHGADIYSGYLGGDKTFIDEIEDTKRTREFLSLTFTYEAMFESFPDDIDTLFREFIKMILFDAWVGVNDRHSYNWGIIRDITSNKKPAFAPLFDTSRGLFWNEDENKLLNLTSPSLRNSFIERYINNSKPKISWDGDDKMNHIDLFRFIFDNEFEVKKEFIRGFFSKEKLDMVFHLLDTEFKPLFSEVRLNLIKLCLMKRNERIMEIIK
ncbi:MAG: hypothetical protein HOK35_10190 [Cytophagia bacterium]|jgi:hypothetical protein|nr:hypothetical protein [Cytophagia bacterium]